MNKQMKQDLETVVNSIVNEDSEAATAAFHSYLRAKTQAILMNESDDEECDEDKDDKDDKKSDDKEDKDEDDKDDKKSDDKEDKDEEDEK